jgi:NYN domain/OST-HTH/LOTUS domain
MLSGYADDDDNENNGDEVTFNETEKLSEFENMPPTTTVTSTTTARTITKPAIETMETPRIALLIDVENISHTHLPAIMAAIEELSGDVCVRRMYGDFTSTLLSGWRQQAAVYALMPVTRFHFSPLRKNVSDFALIIDAMDLLHDDAIDIFCIVSGDGDFLELTIRIRSSGLRVYAFGNKSTPDVYRNACTQFINIDNLRDVSIDAHASTIKSTTMRSKTSHSVTSTICDDRRETIMHDEKSNSVAAKMRIERREARERATQPTTTTHFTRGAAPAMEAPRYVTAASLSLVNSNTEYVNATNTEQLEAKTTQTYAADIEKEQRMMIKRAAVALVNGGGSIGDGNTVNLSLFTTTFPMTVPSNVNPYSMALQMRASISDAIVSVRNIDSGWAKLTDVGNFLRNRDPNFDLRNYGGLRLLEVVEKFPDLFEVARQEVPPFHPIVRCVVR